MTGEVSSIAGRRQAPWLKAATWVTAVFAIIGIIVPGVVGDAAAGIAVSLVIAAPLVRVMWVVYRFIQERDARFVSAGLALLTAVSLGVLAALLG